MHTKTVGQVVVEALVAEGVEFVFGLAGSHVLDIFDVLADQNTIRHVVTKHENNASLMAGMYGRLTGRPGVVLVTAGPGAVNSLSGVAQAYDCAAPLVHISGTVPRGSVKETFHGVDQDGFLAKVFSELTKWSVRVEHPRDVPAVLAKAFTLATTGRPGPVHIEIPRDVLETGPLEMPAYRRERYPFAVPDEGFVTKAADLLWTAKCPMICAGKGVVAQRATDQLLSVADALRAPVTTPWDAVGAIPTAHPLWAGTFNPWSGDPLATDLMTSADVMLVVGLRAGTEISKALAEHTTAQIIHIGFDDATGDLWDGALLSTNGNARLYLDALIVALQGRGRREDTAVEQRIATYHSALDRGLSSIWDSYRYRTPVHYGLAVAELKTRLRKDAIVVTGVGNHSVWGRRALPVHHPFGCIREGAWGGMGYELPGAIAAKMVFPERQVVALSGDGSFLMSCSDFGTAIEVGANIILLILNDGKYGMIEQMQERRHGRSYGADLCAPDFARFAESFGAAGVSVKHPDDLAAALDSAMTLAEKTPVIVDIVSDPGYPLPRLEEIVRPLYPGS